MSSFDLGTIKGYGPFQLAQTVAQLVREGVTFTAKIEGTDEWTITLTGGY